ncbi:MAG: DMT family transporter [Planctomycetes bacterium]|nr:DMT family transporter [Planctomycetota bacterium]
MAHLLMPFASSILYVFAALLLKESAGRGAGIWWSAVVNNLVCGVVFGFLWLLGGTLPAPAAWVQPAAAAGLFVAGQVLGFLAIQRGDVSVATPVMGIKVILVALFVTLILGQRVPPVIWAAAALSSAGILFLGRGGGGAGGGRTAPSLVFGGLAAATFALFDVLVQKWSPGWGAGRFLPVMLGFVAVYSTVLVAFARVTGETVPQAAWRPLLLGSLLIAVQGVLLISALALYSKATTINVVYSARGLWSVLVVWSVGHWFGNRERERGAAVFRTRLAGAALLLAAVVLAVAAR